MKKVITLIVVLLCVSMSLLACGGKNTGTDENKQTQAQMSWQEQYELGIRLLNEGKYEDAILAFQAAIQIDPKNVDAYLALADVHMQMGNTKKAQSVLQSGADACNKRDQDKIFSFAAQYELTIEINNTTQKEEDRQEQPESNSYDKMDYDECMEAGNDLIQQGKYEDAIQAFEKAIEKKKKDLQGYLGLFEAYRQMGDMGQAATVLQQAYDRCDNWYDREQIEAYAKSISYLVVDGQIVPFDAAVHLAGLTRQEKVEFYLQLGGNANHWCFEDGILLDGRDSRTMNVPDAMALSGKLGWGDMSYDMSDIYSYRMTTEVGSIYDIPFAEAGQDLDHAGDQNHFEFLQLGSYQNPEYEGWFEYVKAGYANKPATGVYDIHMGDSFERVLEQLGWKYAQEIAALVCEASGDELPFEVRPDVYAEGELTEGEKSEENRIIRHGRADVIEMTIYLDWAGGDDYSDVEIIFGFDGRDGYALHYMVLRQFYR